ncbi:major capsid protein [Antrihabitans sp. NCIMB 15449]|uniref:Major capsid protein n=1 Tax=Antrihabitans spumae TaxID=3373370 RepID=A0ABW7JII3_9NOCA
MPNALIPELNGRRLTVDVSLRQPSYIRARIAELADEQLLLDKFFSPFGGPVQGGGLLYTVIKASDFYTSTDIERRTPKTEYKVVQGVDPESKLAPLVDWGGKFSVSDEEKLRNNTSLVDQSTTQLANTIARKLDIAALAAIDAAVTGENTLVGNDWGDLVTTGPLTDITPNADRPTADFSAAQLAADLQELGIRHDLLIVHPNQAHALRVGYGDQLADVLASAGLELFANPRITAGTGYVLTKGEAGSVGFEAPLTVETYDDRSIRSTWVQAYAVPAFAVEKPYAVKKLTGLAG